MFSIVCGRYGRNSILCFQNLSFIFTWYGLLFQLLLSFTSDLLYKIRIINTNFESSFKCSWHQYWIIYEKIPKTWQIKTALKVIFTNLKLKTNKFPNTIFERNIVLNVIFTSLKLWKTWYHLWQKKKMCKQINQQQPISPDSTFLQQNTLNQILKLERFFSF